MRSVISEKAIGVFLFSLIIMLIPASGMGFVRGDIDGNDKVGLEETIYSLQVGAGLQIPLSVTTINVPADHATIQAAIDAASDGDTINIAAGTYNEALTITRKALVLNGAGSAATIINGGAGHGIMIESSPGVVIENLAVQGNKGIYARRHASIRVGLVNVKNCSDRGIEVDENSTAQITDGTIVESNGRDGIGVLRNSGITISGTVITRNNASNGVQAFLGCSVLLAESTFTSSGNGGFGINVSNSSGIYLATSTVAVASNSSDGVNITQSSSAGITSDASLTISGNAHANGISVYGASRFWNGGSIEVEDARQSGLIASGSCNVSVEGLLAISNCGSIGFNLILSSSAYVTSGLQVTNCAEFGIAISRGASLLADPAASITVTGTRQPYGIGIGVWENAVMRSRGGTFRIQNNSGDGFQVGRNSTLAIRQGDAGLDAVVSGNGGNGLTLYEQGCACIDPGFSITGNAIHGIAVYHNSECTARGVTVQNNGDNGINAWNGVCLFITDATITGNTSGDVSLAFGSMSSINGGSVGTIMCDESVLSIGEWRCP